MKGRIIKSVLAGGAALLVLVAIASVVSLLYIHSLASRRSIPVEGLRFVTADTCFAMLVKWRPADKGVLDLSNKLAEAYDKAREKSAGAWERMAYFVLGFSRASDLITRPLPAEYALIVRYDPQKAEFHTYAACSVSGLAALGRNLAGHLSLFAPGVARKYGRRTHSDETFFVPENKAGPPAPYLDKRDVKAVLPPDAFSQACWTMVGNTIILSRRAESLSLALDQLKAIYANASSPEPALINAVIPKAAEDVDMRGALLNRRGELACLLDMVGELIEARELAPWVRSDDGFADLATIKQISFLADVRRPGRVVFTVRLMYTNYWSALRVCSALGDAFKAWCPPPPIDVQFLPDLRPDDLQFRVIISGVGEYLRRRAFARVPQ